MLAKSHIQDRRLIDRRSAGVISISELGTQAGYGLMITISCPRLTKHLQRASKPYKHRGEGRRTFGTSRDVMPAMAGYTSTPPVTTTIIKIRDVK